jgi:hypothetical protein
MQIDGLSAAHRGREAGDGNDGGQAGEEGKNAFCPGGAEPCHQNLQRGAQQKRTWSNQNQGRCIHIIMLDALAIEGM